MVARNDTEAVGIEGPCRPTKEKRNSILKLIPEKYNQLTFETVEQARDGIFWIDEKGYIHMANMAACNALSYTRAELLTMNISEIDIDVPPDRFKDLWNTTKTKGVCQLEARHKRKDNLVYPVEVITYYVSLGSDEEYMCAFFRDISDKKETETKLRSALKEVTELKKKLEEENTYLREEIKFNYEFANVIGQSHELKEVLEKVKQVAGTLATVLITGETGTGKELIARAVHHLSDRKNKSFIHLNCASLPGTLIESELFGYDKGAFTGADRQKIGRFELADGGTIFLDEIAELPVKLQSKMLKVLQEKEFERLGSMESTKVDIRVIAATNKNLEALVADGRFRDDLYYRLNVFPIEMPPLRERKEDIPLLVNFFVDKFSKIMGKKINRVSKESMENLISYHWPGNVRELKNIVERGTIVAKGHTLHFELPEASASKFCAGGMNLQGLKELEKQHLLEVLGKTQWRIRGINGAAEILGLKPSTLEYRMKKFNITRPIRIN